MISFSVTPKFKTHNHTEVKNLIIILNDYGVQRHK